MREAFSHHRREFDVALSADNSVPHLLSDQEIQMALGDFYRCTKPHGICLLSVRDYDKQVMESGAIKPFAAHQQGDKRYLLFQVWRVSGDTYELSLYCVEDSGRAGCKTTVTRTEYYAISIGEIIRLMRKAGFGDVKRLDGRFFQSVIIGRKPQVRR